MRAKTSGESESKLTVRRLSPASRRARACLAKSEPLVVSAISSSGCSRTQQRHELVQLAAQQRLPARQAHLAQAERHERGDHARNLLETQDVRARQIAVLVIEVLPRHAVAAAEVAAIGDAHPQIRERTCRADR